MGLDLEPELRTFVERWLGPCQIEKDWSWEHGGAHVVQLRDAGGVAWFTKRHRRPETYERERSAYLRWVPALRDRAPALRAHDDALGVLLLSAVPGTLSSGFEVGVHHDAGQVLRRLHEAESLPVWPDLSAAKLAELESWVPHTEGLFDRGEVDFARSELSALEGIPAPARVPCHLDYTPRNWLIDRDRVQVIDFEWAKPEVWVNDLARLYFGYWRDRPELREAFLSGYGRTPTSDELAIMRASYALSAVWMTVWARWHGEHAFEMSLRDNLHAVMRNEI